MKHVIFFSVSILTLSCTNAQKPTNGEVPQSVKDAFAAKYPTAKVEKWDKEAAGYEASFVMNKIEMSANFSNEGVFEEVEQEIKMSELPKAVVEYCTKTYAGYKMSEAAKITDAAGVVKFEAEMSKGKEHFDAIFSSTGTFESKGATVSTSEEEEDEDNEEAKVEVPAKVSAAFTAKYPTAKLEKWDKEEAGYEASFVMNKIEMSANFSNEGVFEEVEEEINASSLPKAVTEYCTKTYPSYRLSESAKITDAAGKISYEAEMAKGKEHFDVIFDANGGFVKKGETASEDEEDEDEKED